MIRHTITIREMNEQLIKKVENNSPTEETRKIRGIPTGRRRFCCEIMGNTSWTTIGSWALTAHVKTPYPYWLVVWNSA